MQRGERARRRSSFAEVLAAGLGLRSPSLFLLPPLNALVRIHLYVYLVS